MIKGAPFNFHQIWALWKRIGHSWATVIYALLPNKKLKTYSRLAVIIRDLAPVDAMPEKIILDFELSPIIAYKGLQTEKKEKKYVQLNEHVKETVQNYDTYSDKLKYLRCMGRLQGSRTRR